MMLFSVFIVSCFAALSSAQGHHAHDQDYDDSFLFTKEIFPLEGKSGDQKFGEVMASEGDWLFISSGLTGSGEGGGKSKVSLFQALFNSSTSSLKGLRKVKELVSPGLVNGDGFGSSLSISPSRDFLLIGAPLDSSLSYNAGKVFLFDKSQLIDNSDNEGYSNSTTPAHAPAPPRPPSSPLIFTSPDTSSSSSSSFKETFGSSVLAATDSLIVIGASGSSSSSSFGTVYFFASDPSASTPPNKNRWLVTGRVQSPFISSSLSGDLFGSHLQLLSKASLSSVIVAIGSPGFSAGLSYGVNKGAVFLTSYSSSSSSSSGKKQPAPQIATIATILNPDSSSSHSFGSSFHFTENNDFVFISAVSENWSGIVFYCERDNNKNENDFSFSLKQRLEGFSSLGYLDNFGSSLLLSKEKIAVTLAGPFSTSSDIQKAIATTNNADNAAASPSRYLRRLEDNDNNNENEEEVEGEQEDEEENEEEDDEDDGDSPLPSSPPSSIANSTSLLSLSLLLVSAPSSSAPIIPSHHNSNNNVKEGGMVYVFSNHRSVIRDFSCSLNSNSNSHNSDSNNSHSESDLSPPIALIAYYRELCFNYSHPINGNNDSSSSAATGNDWQLVSLLTADNAVLQPHSHYGTQLTSIFTINNNPNDTHTQTGVTMISAPFASSLSQSSSSSTNNNNKIGVVYEESAKLSLVINDIRDEVERILNNKQQSSSSDDNNKKKSSNNNNNGIDDFFADFWRSLSSKEGIIVTATCLPALLLAGLAVYLYVRPPLTEGAAYSKMLSPSNNLNNHNGKEKEKERSEKYQQHSYFNHNNHHNHTRDHQPASLFLSSFFAAKQPSFSSSSNDNNHNENNNDNNNDNDCEATLSRLSHESSWKNWLQHKYSSFTTSNNALPQNESNENRSQASAHSSSKEIEKEIEVEEKIYDSSYPSILSPSIPIVTSAAAISQQSSSSSSERKWTQNPLHRHSKKNNNPSFSFSSFPLEPEKEIEREEEKADGARSSNSQLPFPSALSSSSYAASMASYVNHFLLNSSSNNSTAKKTKKGKYTNLNNQSKEDKDEDEDNKDEAREQYELQPLPTTVSSSSFSSFYASRDNQK